jgi:hypothetical protein
MRMEDAMERHVRRSIAPELDERDDPMPDLDSIVPLLSPPLIFRNGKIIARRAEMPRRKESRPAVSVRPRRAASR